jgi:hypothetical protein
MLRRNEIDQINLENSLVIITSDGRTIMLGRHNIPRDEIQDEVQNEGNREEGKSSSRRFR